MAWEVAATIAAAPAGGGVLLWVRVDQKGGQVEGMAAAAGDWAEGGVWR